MLLNNAVWCNGSITDFDSVGIGSNPVTAAKGEKNETTKDFAT